MADPFQSIAGSVTAPEGFLAAGVECGIKPAGLGKGSSGKPDLALIVSEVPAAVAGTFTTNQVCAAPVKISARRARRGTAQAVIVNSGNANACTGTRGLRDAEAMTELVADELLMPVEDVLVASTGRIGIPLPMRKVEAGIHEAVGRLHHTTDSSHEAARAIMTSDTRPKEVAVELMLGNKKVRIGGICKGAGMIQPGMSLTGRRPALHATMLCFLTTDAAIRPKALRQLLGSAVARSFNRITVDGDMSTNDTVLLLANGLAGNREITGADSAPGRKFAKALDHVALELAKKIVLDGEGAARFVTVRLEGARNDRDADTAARTVANSQLVKTSWCGGDPNWGRIMDALGYSTAKIVEEKIDIGYSLPGSRDLKYIVRQGSPTRTALKTLGRITKKDAFDLHINLNLGPGSAIVYSSDLTEKYVTFNRGE